MMIETLPKPLDRVKFEIHAKAMGVSENITYSRWLSGSVRIKFHRRDWGCEWKSLDYILGNGRNLHCEAVAYREAVSFVSSAR